MKPAVKMKSTPTQKLIKAIERERGGVVVIWYPDLEVRDFLIREVAGLSMFDVDPLLTASVTAAVLETTRLVLLTPDDEARVVRELDGCEGFLTDPGREHPVVLFLSRDNGRTVLARTPGLSSLVRGRAIDPKEVAEIDTQMERAKFTEETGNSPEDWLVAWRAGQICRNGDALCRSYLAAMLVDRTWLRC
jgi:hypothetical protein